jgi:glucosyl-dolichyl phosphate glucuronosyltransferase
MHGAQNPRSTVHQACAWNLRTNLQVKTTISIVICTRDRANSLAATLDSIQSVGIPNDFEVELLVVDNGSVDRTRLVVEEYRHSVLPASYIYEPRRGKGYAYNSAGALAKGNILLFTDDDVRVPRDWVEGMCRPITRGAAYAVQGGVRIAPHLERRWLRGSLRTWVAAVEDPQNAPEGLVGANMAFLREAFEITGGFDHRLGPGAAGFFDDTVFGWALKAAGKRLAYRPEIAVEHHFDPARLTLRSYMQTARKMAESHAIVVAMQNAARVPPSATELIFQLPGLSVRVATQLVRWIFLRQPDAGFVVRYYELLFCAALRRRLKGRG